MKIEIDFYTGDQISKGGSTGGLQSTLIFIKPKYDFTDDMNEVIGLFQFDPASNIFSYYGGGLKCNYTGIKTMNFKNWYSLIYYLDFDNDKIYMMVPSLNHIQEFDFLIDKLDIKALMLKSSNWIGSQATTSVYKYDNIVISAVNKVTLSTQGFLLEKFNVFPNPATDIVNISNSDDVAIKEVNVYGISGELIKSNLYTNETNVQLDISTFTSGLYVFSIKTENGTIIKNVIKN